MDPKDMVLFKGEMGVVSDQDIARFKAAAKTLRKTYKKKKAKKRLIEVHCAEGVSEAECYGEE